MKINWFTSLIWIVISSALTSPSFGQKIEVQANLQAALLKKILAMNSKFDSERNAILVFVDNQNKDDGETIAKALEDVGLNVQINRSGTFPESTSGVVGVLLFSPSQSVLEVCSANKILTFSGYRYMVKDGHASLAIINEGGKPKPIINKPRIISEDKQPLLAALSKVSIIVE